MPARAAVESIIEIQAADHDPVGKGSLGRGSGICHTDDGSAGVGLGRHGTGDAGWFLINPRQGAAIGIDNMIHHGLPGGGAYVARFDPRRETGNRPGYVIHLALPLCANPHNMLQ